MANEFKFTWDKMNLSFPENKEDMDKIGMEFDHYYPKSPDFTNTQVSFAYKNGYGVQIYFNQPLGSWTEIAPERVKKAVTKMHLDLSHKLYEKVVEELGNSIDILDGWRKYITKNVKGEWIGHLQNNISFEKERDSVSLWDYYKFYINSDGEENNPAAVLFKISELPTDSLNEKWKGYAKLAENCSINAIRGKTFAECIKNTDEIYKIADELKELKF